MITVYPCFMNISSDMINDYRKLTIPFLIDCGVRSLKIGVAENPYQTAFYTGNIDESMDLNSVLSPGQDGQGGIRTKDQIQLTSSSECCDGNCLSIHGKL